MCVARIRRDSQSFPVVVHLSVVLCRWRSNSHDWTLSRRSVHLWKRRVRSAGVGLWRWSRLWRRFGRSRLSCVAFDLVSVSLFDDTELIRWDSMSEDQQIFYSAPLGERSIWRLVCLSVYQIYVCLCPQARISGTAGPIVTKFFVQIPCGRGVVLVWRICDTLCTSGFMDDVTFGCNGPYNV